MNANIKYDGDIREDKWIVNFCYAFGTETNAQFSSCDSYVSSYPEIDEAYIGLKLFLVTWLIVLVMLICWGGAVGASFVDLFVVAHMVIESILLWASQLCHLFLTHVMRSKSQQFCILIWPFVVMG